MRACLRACSRLLQCCTRIHGYFTGKMAVDSMKNAQFEPGFACKPLDFSSSGGDSKSRLSRLIHGSQTFILPETITLAGDRVRYGDTESAYNVAQRKFRCIGIGVPSTRLLFVRRVAPAAADAFRSYRIPLLTFTARIFLSSSWRKPLCTVTRIVCDLIPAPVCVCVCVCLCRFRCIKRDISRRGKSARSAKRKQISCREKRHVTRFVKE